MLWISHRGESIDAPENTVPAFTLSTLRNVHGNIQKTKIMASSPITSWQIDGQTVDTAAEFWQPTPVFLPGESHGWRSLVGCSPRGRTESDTTEAT